MSIAQILDALGLPPEAMVEQRIPKKMLAEQGAPAAADKRQIQDGIEELNWIAALKPNNIGVPAFRNDEREYLEITVLTVVYRAKAKIARLNELVHRAIPYPVLLLASFSTGREGESERFVQISAAHKRFSQNEAGKVVVDEVLATKPISESGLVNTDTQEFLASLSLSASPTGDLFALYQGWLDSMLGYAAASITGCFSKPGNQAEVGLMRERLESHAKLVDEIAGLKVQAGKEKQMNRLVDLNMQIKRLESHLALNHAALAEQRVKNF